MAIETSPAHDVYAPTPKRTSIVLSALALLLAVLLRPAPIAGKTATPSDATAVFRHLGSWVDIFATPAWREPEAVADALRAHGVGTLYLQTSNYSQARDVVHPGAVGRFIDEAHAHGLKIVAWYLPSFANPSLDARRVRAALRFRSPSGQAFDSFALDIEASVVRNVPLRNARLLSLARTLRATAPSGMPLGAIVPSPVGMRRHPHYWPNFPFATLARTFDAFLPMAYFSYYARTSAAAYAYAHDVIVELRSQSRVPAMPVHIIGGLANRASSSAVNGFLQAAHDCAAAGVSLYAYLQTTARQWSELGRVSLGAAPRPSCYK